MKNKNVSTKHQEVKPHMGYQMIKPLFRSKKKVSSYEAKYKKNAIEYDKIKYSLKERGKINSVVTYDEVCNRWIRDNIRYYNILKSYQKDENKHTFLITLTNTADTKLITNFVNKVKLKNKTGEVLYFGIAEPTKNGKPHIHIKLVIDKYPGLKKDLRKCIQEVNPFSFNNIKRQKKVDHSNYLLKCLRPETIKQYIGWASTVNKNNSYKKSIKKSLWIRISETVKTTYQSYLHVLKYLINNKSNKFYGFEDVKEYLISVSSQYNKTHKVFTDLRAAEFKNELKKLESSNNPMFKYPDYKEMVINKLKKKKRVSFSEVFDFIHDAISSKEALKIRCMQVLGFICGIHSVHTVKRDLIKKKYLNKVLIFMRVLYIYLNQVKLLSIILFSSEIKNKGSPEEAGFYKF